MVKRNRVIIGTVDTTVLETFLKRRILPELERGRPGFDAPHTLEVAAWIKRILKSEPTLGLDVNVMLIAAYAHDWGYTGMFHHQNTLRIDEIIASKQRHMKLGAKKISRLLTDPFFSFLSDAEKQRCVHLVAVHDRLEVLHDADELVLMEADTLSGLDMSGKSLLDSESNVKFIQAVQTSRLPKFITKFSKSQAQKLLRRRAAHYRSID